MQLWKRIGIYVGGLLAAMAAALGFLQAPWYAFVLLVLLGGLMTLLIRQALAPLDAITRIVESIAAGRLAHEQVEVSGSDELARLSRATNQMLTQLGALALQAEEIAHGRIGVVEVEERVMRSGRLSDADVPVNLQGGELERSFALLTNQMRRLTIQARVIARDELESPLLDERIPGELGESFALMVRNLRTIAERAKRIAHGDLTSYVSGSGDLNTAFNHMVDGLKEVVEQITETALHVSTAAEEILVVLRDQELAASHQASSVEETRRTMESLLSSARKIAESTQTVFKSAEKTQANNRIVGDRIGELKTHTERIAEILEVIKAIADRSDLLALNASLEGMRAGEAGKGFTLVAVEMRRLAENIKASVGDIKELVSDIRESSLASVMATEEGSRLSERTTESALKISLITQQQQSGTEQVTQSMDELSHLINQGVAGTRQVTLAAGEMADLSDSLRQLVEKFRIETSSPRDVRPVRTGRSAAVARQIARSDRSTEPGLATGHRPALTPVATASTAGLSTAISSMPAAAMTGTASSDAPPTGPALAAADVSAATMVAGASAATVTPGREYQPTPRGTPLGRRENQRTDPLSAMLVSEALAEAANDRGDSGRRDDGDRDDSPTVEFSGSLESPSDASILRDLGVHSRSRKPSPDASDQFDAIAREIEEASRSDAEDVEDP